MISEPEPNPPLRYAHQKARDIQRTIQLEEQMLSILRPEQFQEYLAEVGDDPFQSGFGFKTQRLSCTGKTADEVVEQVANLWGGGLVWPRSPPCCDHTRGAPVRVAGVGPARSGLRAGTRGPPPGHFGK